MSYEEMQERDLALAWRQRMREELELEIAQEKMAAREKGIAEGIRKVSPFMSLEQISEEFSIPIETVRSILSH